MQEGRTLRSKAGSDAHARPFKRLRTILGVVMREGVVDLGYGGADADNPGVQIIHRGKYKSLSDHDKKLLKRRQAIEPLIGHTQADPRMDRCWLQGAVGGALHALCCAARYNIGWLLRAIARLGLEGLFCALSVVLSYTLGMRVMALRINLGNEADAAPAWPCRTGCRAHAHADGRVNFSGSAKSMVEKPTNYHF